MSERISGLARILSSQPLPLTPMFRTNDPVRIASELEQYVRNLHIYLADLFGQLTAENLITTINQGGGLGFDKIVKKQYLYSGTDTNLTVTLDNSIDWREGVVIGYARTADTLEDLYTEANAFGPAFYELGGIGTVYPFAVFQAGNGSDPTGGVYVDTDGSLKMTILNSNAPGHDEGYIHVFVAMIARTGNVSTVVDVGNGA
jgi:hypothetical protein